MPLTHKLFVGFLLTCAFAQAQELVKDINPVLKGQIPSNDFGNQCKPCGSFVYFVGTDREHGSEMWRTDGTSEGTIRMTDIKGGADNGVYPLSATTSVCMNNRLYFWQEAGLWSTNGLPNGLIHVKQGTMSNELAAFQNQVAFVINESIYLTNGDQDNVTLLKNFEPIPGALAATVYDVAATPNKLYFTSMYYPETGPPIKMELWVWNGLGMEMVYETDQLIVSPVVVGDKLVFSVSDNDHGRELWVSDGTAEGTELLVDANPGPDNSNAVTTEVIDGELFFTTEQPTTATWVSDGTPENTRVLFDGMRAKYIKKYHDKVYFSINTLDYFTQGVLRTDLDFTNLETVVPDFQSNALAFLTIANDKLIYAYPDGTSGLEIFSIDDTDFDLTPIKDINQGSGNSDPRSFTQLGSKSVFIADDGEHGLEFWATDGTEGGTILLKDIFAGTLDPLMSEVYQYNKKLYFIASSADSGQEVWTSDGTDAGTYPIFEDDALSKDMMFGINNYVITTANGFVKIDVDTEDATPLALPSGYTNYVEIHAQPGLFIGDEVFFNTAAGPSPETTNGLELWKADVSTNEITPVKDINPGPEGSVVFAEKPKFNGMGVALNDKIVFPAGTADGMEPWVSDGTEEGTVLLKNIRGSGDSFPRSFTIMNDEVFFIALSDEEGSELWVTDGTPEGTHIVKDIAPGAKDGILTEPLAVYADRVFFVATTDGTESKLALWTSDGTESGTVQYDKLIPDGWSITANLFAAGDYLYFFASHKDFGNELWSTDGTVEGTTLIELEPGAAGSVVNDFINANGTLFFSTNGKIWRSLGTPESTVFLGEAYPASELMLTDEYIVFKVDNPFYGKELFRVDLNGPVGQLITFTGFTNLKPGNEYEISVRASSGLPVDLVSSDPSVIEISGTTIIVHKPGTVTFTATQGGDVDYDPTTETLTVVIEGLEQTITFNPIPNKTMLDGKFTVDASASSELALEFESSDPSKASIDPNGEVTLHNEGTVTITASQPGNDAYKSAEPVSRTFSISKVDQAITFNEVETKAIGTGSFQLSASSTGGLPITFSTSSTNISITGSTVGLLAAGHATITASQPGNNVYNEADPVSRTFCINPVKPTITQAGLTEVTLTSSATNNVWLLNDTPVSFAGQEFVVTQEGIYKAAATVDGCQGEFSDGVSVVITGLEEELKNVIELYPNPVQKTLFVKAKTPGIIRISDMNGREKYNQFVDGETGIDVSLYAEGMYVVIFNDERIKFIKLH